MGTINSVADKMLSECPETLKQNQNLDHNTTSQFINEFGFTDNTKQNEHMHHNNPPPFTNASGITNRVQQNENMYRNIPSQSINASGSVNHAQQNEKMNDNIPLRFINGFGFIDYKHDGSVPWTTENILLSKEHTSVTQILGIDCEMVGVGVFKISSLGRVSIVNEHGYCIYDTFVKPMEAITDYNTQYSGIRAEDLVDAPPANLVIEQVASIVKGRVLVGHAIHHDLEVLKLDHPLSDLRDTSNYFQHRNGHRNPPSLKSLVKNHFNMTIQDGEHSSIQDAQATLRLYLLFKEEWEKDALERRRKANLTDTVTDITCMHVQPRPSDLFTESSSDFFRPNKLVGPYYSSEEYKDIQFRLLMLDVLRPLRADIRKFKQRRSLQKHYKNIRIAAESNPLDLDESNFEVRATKTLQIPIPGNGLQGIDWDNREIFLSGSLLILSPDNFRTIKCAKVLDVGRNQRYDSDILHLNVNFLMDGPSWKVTDRDEFELIESQAFFLPYEYTLNFLQDVDLDTFPMKKYIVDVVTKSSIASNLLKDTANQIDFSILMGDNISSESRVRARPLEYNQWPSASDLKLDESQYEGLKKALTQELTIIQGPPGTGKSHVSLQIVKMLLTNKWLSSSPILIVAYTNHALDELLESVLKFMTDGMHGGDLKKAEQSLLRIGGGCESNAIIPCTIKFKNEMLREKSTNKQWVKSLEKALLKVDGLDFTSKLLQHGIINFKLIPQMMLAKLESKAKTKDIFRLWTKSQREMESNVFSWFGLNKETVEVRPTSLISKSDIMFMLLCKNLESILNETFPKIPSTFEELQGKSLHYADQNQQWLTRWGVYLYLVGQLGEIVKTTQNELLLANKQRKELEHYVKRNQTLQQARVVGMTTTGAVKFKSMVEKQFKPSIVIVEEAAHVLEAYVVASLTHFCTQLILIGDHKQLRPMVADHDLTKDFLDVSLMERLVENGKAQNTKNWTQLKVQHRMRPDIAKLICPAIYDELENHSDVEHYPDVKGCLKNLFFVQHENPESMDTLSPSRFNAYEARYIIGLLSYFTDCGYLPTQVTVICTYLAQKTLIENSIKNDPKINETKISTVDGYQGKQNDIIILSLVRNNSDNNVGFLKTDNRVCVALSRARHGLIMVGNMDILAPSSDTWSSIQRILTDSDSIGTELPLTHPQLFKLHDTLSYPTLQPSSPVRGGPNHRRGQSQNRSAGSSRSQSRVSSQMSLSRQYAETVTLSCGHSVNTRPGSRLLQCNVKIAEQLRCGHVRRVLCREKGQTTNCYVPVQKMLKCGHEKTVPCHKLYAVTPCSVPVTKSFPCGHASSVPCQTLSTATCTATVKKILSCGHPILVFCINKTSDIKCVATIAHTYPCGHTHRLLCSTRGQTLKVCDFKIDRKLPCGHIQSTACHQNPSAIKCEATTTHTYPCGHSHRVLCSNGELMSRLCGWKIDRKLPCGHIQSGACHQNPLTIKCEAIITRTAPCGHTHRFLCCMTGEQISKVCVGIVNRKLPCGHTQPTVCSQDPLTMKCRAIVKHTYPCGHSHRFLCSAGPPALKLCSWPIDRKLPCGHIQTTACHQNPLTIKCRRLETINNSTFECHRIVDVMKCIDDLCDNLNKIQTKEQSVP